MVKNINNPDAGFDGVAKAGDVFFKFQAKPELPFAGKVFSADCVWLGDHGAFQIIGQYHEMGQFERFVINLTEEFEGGHELDLVNDGRVSLVGVVDMVFFKTQSGSIKFTKSEGKFEAWFDAVISANEKTYEITGAHVKYFV